MMMRHKLIALCATFFLNGCAARIPSGPSVMVLPGTGKSFEQFKYDDYVCRQWAAQQCGASPTHAADNTMAAHAAVGTVVGAATGAAIGAAAGDPAMGAAVGSGVGLLGGSLSGADSGQSAQWSVQRRYDAAYMQCMYANGHQIPIPAGYERAQRSSRPADIPPPPRGAPPPPPPGY